MTNNNGLEGVIAADTVLSHTDGNSGTIWVRGHTIDDLVAHHGFEGTVAIIWEGFVGSGLTRAAITREFGESRTRAFAAMNDWIGAAARRPLLEGVRIALAAGHARSQAHHRGRLPAHAARQACRLERGARARHVSDDGL